MKKLLLSILFSLIIVSAVSAKYTSPLFGEWPTTTEYWINPYKAKTDLLNNNPAIISALDPTVNAYISNYETFTENVALCEVRPLITLKNPLPSQPYPEAGIDLTIYTTDGFTNTFFAEPLRQIGEELSTQYCSRWQTCSYTTTFIFYEGGLTNNHNYEPVAEDCLYIPAGDYYFEYKLKDGWRYNSYWHGDDTEADEVPVLVSWLDPILQPYWLRATSVYLGYGNQPDPPAPPSSCDFDILNPFPFILCLVIPSQSVFETAIHDLSELQMDKFGGISTIAAAVSDAVFDIEPYPLPSNLSIPYTLPFSTTEYTAQIAIPTQIADGISIIRSLLGIIALYLFALYIIKRIPEII